MNCIPQAAGKTSYFDHVGGVGHKKVKQCPHWRRAEV